MRLDRHVEGWLEAAILDGLQGRPPVGMLAMHVTPMTERGTPAEVLTMLAAQLREVEGQARRLAERLESMTAAEAAKEPSNANRR